MGVIYGAISLTDKPLDPAIPGAMRKANSFWGPDGDDLWHDEHAALGSLIMFNTPEAIFEKQPIYFDDNRKVMVATARIDNRDDLCRSFEIPLSARDMYPDSYYIRLAYEKWGDDCPDHLIGDWSFAVWDKVGRKLFVARDHHGIMACYYYQGSDFFIFSSSLKGILCLPQVPKKVNEYKIAQILVNWNEGGPPTCYENIFRLPPAHTLTLENNKVTTNRYWYLEHTPEIHLKNDQEYIDRFRELYTEAVRCRLRSYRPVGATLSGGLDSGSVCILASQELAKQGKRLPAFTAVPMYDVPWPKNRIGDEGPLALALAEKLGNVDVTLCKAEGIGVFEGIEEMMGIQLQSDFSLTNSFWILDIFKKSEIQNIGAILTGQRGNITISWPVNNNDNIIIYFIKNILKLLKSYRKKSINKLEIFDISIEKKRLENSKFQYQLKSIFLSNFNRRKKLMGIGSNMVGDRWFPIGNNFKMEVRDPTVDIRLVKFLFRLKKSSNFYNNKKLFEIIFKGYFEEEILMRKKRGIQSSDLKCKINMELDKGKYSRYSDNFRYKNINEILKYYAIQKMREL